MRYSSAETSLINTANTQIDISSSSEVSVFSLIVSSLDLNFEVTKQSDASRHANGDHIRLVILGPVDLYRNSKKTMSSGKHLEDTIHAHIVSLMYKLITSPKATNDFSIRFDRDLVRRQQKLINNKKFEGFFHVRILLKDMSVFADYQENAIYDLGYKLTLTRNKEDTVLNKAQAIADG